MTSLRWALFDLDGTLTSSCVMAHLARCCGFGDEADKLTADYESGRKKNLDVSYEYSEILIQILKRRTSAQLRSLLVGVDVVRGIGSTVSLLNKHGVRCGISTITFDFIAEHFRNAYGFDVAFATTLEQDDRGDMTGIVDTARESEDKLLDVQHLCLLHGLEPDQIMFVGNGRSDVDAIRNAGIGVAFNASDVLRSIACIDIRSDSLTSIFAQTAFGCGGRHATCSHAATPPWIGWTAPDAPARSLSTGESPAVARGTGRSVKELS